METYLFEDLENVGIHDLRNLSRNLGHPNPTTKTKKELINYIINSNNSKNPKETNRRGRTPLIYKQNENVENLQHSIQKPKIYFNNYDKIINYHLSSLVYLFNTSDKKKFVSKILKHLK